MTVLWNRHRFSGGTLILDTTNTVVLRGDPERSFDRFEDAAEIGRFAEAAGRFRSPELSGRRLAFERSEAAERRVIALRETADRLFRRASASGEMVAADLSETLRACAACLDGADKCAGEAANPDSATMQFEAALAVSALSLFAGDDWRKVRTCPNCNWLFLDRSRNASRLWCDMSVCGNRQKAKRHYERRKATRREVESA